MKLGIVGLPYSGKTTLFEAITGAHGAAIEHSGGTHAATIIVPDERMNILAERCSPKKVTYAHIEFVDVPGVASDRGREHNVAVLSALREADGLVHVVRFFDWPSAPPHPHGSLDPARDVAELDVELIVADL
ncbi:MAG: GTPase, partial [Pseudomonadota bacterium]